MPELRRYKVVQEREVVVSATNPLNASLLAARVFSNTKKPKDQANVHGPIRERAIEIREDIDATK